MLEVTKCAPQLAIKNDRNNAFKNFFAKRAGFPKFHKKGVDDSFSLSNDQFKMDGKAVKIPNLGFVRLGEDLRFDGKIIGAAISRTADKWYIAVQVELPEVMTQTSENQAVGVDLGVKVLAALSDGTAIAGSKASKKYEKKLRSLLRHCHVKKVRRKAKSNLTTLKRQSFSFQDYIQRWLIFVPMKHIS